MQHLEETRRLNQRADLKGVRRTIKTTKGREN